MKRVEDQAPEERMNLRRKRWLVTLMTLGIIGMSLYGWWQKTNAVDRSTQLRTEASVEASKTSPQLITVYISGMVQNPGVLQVAAGTRAFDAVNAAGGFLPGAEVAKINLAQSLRDGMQINIPGQLPLSKEVGGNPRYASGSSEVEKVNINSADAAAFDRLPGIGPSLAIRIVEYRRTKGPFLNGTDLKKVPGIGDAKYLQLKEKITW